MKILVKRLEAHQPNSYTSPLDIVSPCNPEDGHDDGIIERQCQVTLVRLYEKDGVQEVEEDNYPKALIALKDDSPGKKCSRIMLIFKLDDTQDKVGVR